MKKRILALLLILALAFSLFAACGDKETKETDSKDTETEDVPELAKGYYEVLDENEDTAAYLWSTGKKLTVYDVDGNELMEQTRFSWDEEEEAFVIDEKAAFTVEVSRKTTTFTVLKKNLLGIDKGDYTLEEIEEGDIPVPVAEPEPGEQPETPSETPSSEPEVPAQPEAPMEPENTYVTLPEGYYSIEYYGQFAGYFEFDGYWLTYYDPTGAETLSFLTYDDATGIYTDDMDESFHFEKSDTGYFLIEEGTDEPMQLTTIDALPEFPEQPAVSGSETGDFYPGTPESTYDFIAICRYRNSVLWDYIPEFYIPGWSDYLYYSEADGCNSFAISAANEDASMTSNVLVTMMDSYGMDSICEEVVKSYFDQEEEGTIYDSMIDEGGVQTVDLNGSNAYYRWHDTLTDGQYSTNLILVVDNGDVTMMTVLSGTAYTEDDYLALSDILAEFANYFSLEKSE